MMANLSHTTYTSENRNFLDCAQPSGLDVNQTLNAQDMFWPIPGLIGCTGVTGSVGATYHAHATQMAGPKSPQILAAV